MEAGVSQMSVMGLDPSLISAILGVVSRSLLQSSAQEEDTAADSQAGSPVREPAEQE